MKDGDGQQSGPRPEGESTMSGLKSVFLGAAVASGLALPIISSSQPTAAPIRLDGQTPHPGIQAMLATAKVKEEAAKGKPGTNGRGAGRGRVGPYVKTPTVGVSLNKKHK